MKPLADKLSQLILDALEDMEAVERDPRYAIDMTMWHAPGQVCLVCFGGAVMAGRLEMKPEDELSPEDFPREIASKLLALDCVRTGQIKLAVDRFYGSWMLSVPELIEVTHYHDNPSRFKTEMVLLAAALKEIGL